MSWFEHGGSRIYFEEEGAGDPVLLLPGWAGSIEEFAPLRAALSPKFRVIAADLPGSGKSEPQPRNYPPTYYHDDARGFLALIEHLSATPAHLVGFSDGGEVGLVMAEQKPDAARSLFTWGAAGQIPATADGMLEAMENIVDNPIEPMKEFSQYLKVAYGEENARSMAASFASALRAIIRSGGDISRANAARIVCPALLATGEQDFVATPALVSEIAQAIGHAEFVEVRAASHAIHHEQPDWLVTTASNWLSRQSMRSSAP
jgi:valacyclovir hydrolase